MNAVLGSLAFLGRQWRWLKWPVAIGILVFLFSQNQEALEQLAAGNVRWGYLAAAGAAMLLALLLTFFRWWLLVWALDFKFTLRDAFRLGFIGYLFNYVAPGGAGGDIVKAMLLAKEQPRRRLVAIATVFLDRILGLLALFMVGAAATLVPTPVLREPEFQNVIRGYWLFGSAGIVAVGLMLVPAIPRSQPVQWLTRLPAVGHLFGELIAGVVLYQSRPVVVVAAVLVSLLGHLAMLSVFYLCALAVGTVDVVPNFWAHLQFIPAAELAGVLLPTPGGVGVLEGAVEYCYGLAGAPKSSGLLTAVAFRALSVLLAVVGAGYYMISRREINDVIHEAEEDTSHPAEDSLPQFDHV